MSNSVNNLLLLASYIEKKVSQKQLFMGNYRSARFESLDDCGSTGCALGWAPFVPELALTEDDFYAAEDGKRVDWERYFFRIFPVQRMHNHRLSKLAEVDGTRVTLYCVAFATYLSSDKNLVVARIRHAAHQIKRGELLLTPYVLKSANRS